MLYGYVLACCLYLILRFLFFHNIFKTFFWFFSEYEVAYICI